MTDLPTVKHMSTVTALIEVVRMSIEHGNDDWFIEWCQTEKGFEVFSAHAIWRQGSTMAIRAINGQLYLDEAGPDMTAFEAVYETDGRAQAEKWLRARLVTSEGQQVDGRYGGYVQRVFYVPVGSKLEASRRRVPKNKRRETVRLMED